MWVRVNDMVEVISGRDRGQRGKILKIDRAGNRVVVEGMQRVYKHVRKSQRNPQGGRLSKESYIDASNVMLVCPQTGKRTRVGVRLTSTGAKERFAKRSGVSLGVISPASRS